MVLGNNTTNLNPTERNNFPTVKQKVSTYSCVSTQMKLTAEGNKDIFLQNTLPVYSKVSSLKDIQKSYGFLKDWYGYFFLGRILDHPMESWQQ